MNDQLLAQLFSYQQQQMARNLMINAIMTSPMDRTMLTMLAGQNFSLLRPTTPLSHQGVLLNPATAMLANPDLLMRASSVKPETLNPCASQLTSKTKLNEELPTSTLALNSKQTLEKVNSEPDEQHDLALNPTRINSEAVSSPSAKDGIASQISSENEFSDYEDELAHRPRKKSVKKVQSAKKIKKKRNICGHTDRKHYAKGLCSLCYHKKSRDQKPKLCPHDKLYARDLCQKCYAAKYRNKEQESPEEKIPEDN